MNEFQYDKRQRRRNGLIAAAALLAAVTAAIFSGRYSCPPGDVLRALGKGILDRIILVLELPARLPFFDYSISNPIPQTWAANVDIVLWRVRIPRTIGVLFIGGGLSVAGANYQGVFQNPLVSDGILGVSAGAGLGAAAAIYAGWGGVAINAAAFCGALVAVGLTYTLSHLFRGNRVLMLVLTGTVVGSLFSALLSCVQYLAAGNEVVVSKIVFWLMGAFTGLSAADLAVIVPVITVCCIVLFKMRWRLNALSLGDRQAHSLGVDVKRTRCIIIVATSLISSVCVCYCGLIGWVGVIVPQLARLMIGPDSRKLVPLAFFTGAVFLTVVDILCRTLTASEIPVSIVTAILGAPVFLLLLGRTGKGYV